MIHNTLRAIRYTAYRGSIRKALGRLYTAWDQWQRYWRSYDNYRELCALEDESPAIRLYPCLGDDTGSTYVGPIYFYQDTWAFGRIVRSNPTFHVDVGSHHKTIALLAQVVPVTMVDIRPLSVTLDSLSFRSGSILNLPYDDGTVPSLSSLCVIEHIGLGRYGDELDPYGTEKSIAELRRVLQPGGDLYISAPVGDESRTYFNAHRSFAEEYLLDQFGSMEILERAYIVGNQFLPERGGVDGVACYHLRST